MTRTPWFVLVSSLLWNPAGASADLLQIIHTNDLHSHFEGAENPTEGSYAAVKATIDRIKWSAWDQGLETLVVDAGDFSEGSQFYLADRGEQTWRAMSEMGFDAVVLGNHDWLMGQKDLDRVIRNTKPDFFLLGANFAASKSYPALHGALKSHARLERNMQWISVMGLTTDSFEYAWRAGNGVLKSPVKTAQTLVPQLRKHSDFVIAVTHLGVKADQALVSKTRGIDLVIGGHSHDALREPVYATDPDGRRVPIVQAGEHGEVVGDLLVDFVKGKPARVVRYRLVPIKSNGPRNKDIERFVASARARLEKDYPSQWLHEILAFSDHPFERPGSSQTFGSHFVNEAMRLTAGADVALNSPPLFGQNQPAGPITRESLFLFYPRVFDFSAVTALPTMGWSVWKADVFGFVLQIGIREAVRRGYELSMTGATFRVEGPKGKEEIKDLRVNGRRVSTFGTYRLALPEGIGRVIDEMGWFMELAFRNPESMHVPIWGAMEMQVQRGLAGR